MTLNLSVDYYSQISALPSSDIEVIRALYQACEAKLRNSNGSGPAFDSRLRQMTEAFEVLSNSKARQEYDSMRTGTNANRGHFEELETLNYDDVFNAQVDSSWDAILRYYPEVSRIVERLRWYSDIPAMIFRLTLINTKQYTDAKPIADTILDEFLSYYFGPSPDVKTFALWCLGTKRLGLARELNHSLLTLDNGVEYTRFLARFKSERNLDRTYWNSSTGFDLLKILAAFLGLKIWLRLVWRPDPTVSEIDAILYTAADIVSVTLILLFLYKLVLLFLGK